jgi:hypothetical protein
MTDADREGFARVLALLSEAFSEEVSTTRAEAYFVALRDLELAQLQSMIERALRECKFFPRPVELRELIGDGTPDAGAMYAALIQAKRKAGWEHGVPSGGELLRLAIDRVGGWRTCWMVSDEELWRRVRDVTPGVVAAARARGIPLALETGKQPALPPPDLKLIAGGKDEA